jgi:hypothetical protein
MSQRHGLFGGIAVLACGTVVLEIALTRLHAALFGQPVALLALALPLVGIALGGALVHLVPKLAPPSALLARLAYLAGAASAGTIAALLVPLNVKAFDAFDRGAMLRLAALYASSALPFVAVGAAVAAALRHAAGAASRIHFAALGGAAFGVLTTVATLTVGAPRACLLVAILYACAGVGFYVGARRGAAAAAATLSEPTERRASGAVVATFVLATVVLFAGDLGAPWLKLPSLRWAAIEKVELQRWTEAALITVDKPAGGSAALRLDGTATTTILDGKTTPPAHPDELGYVLHKEQGPAAVLAPGGGRDVRAALRANQKDIYAIEPDPVIVGEVLRGRYKVLGGDLYDRPEVHVIVADPRDYLLGAPGRFRSVVLTLADTSVPAAVGAVALSEARLYTVEAFRDYLRALLPGGTLLVSRPEPEADRLLALAAAGLRSVGATAPAEHLFACSGSKITALLVKRTPFTKDEIGLLRRHCKKTKFAEVVAPDQAPTELRRALFEGSDRHLTALDGLTDLTPPTDDRPFFFQSIAASRLPQILGEPRALRRDRQGLFTAELLVALGAALALLLVAIGWLARGGATGPSAPRLRPMLHFLGLGAGFVLAQLALVPRLVAFLGHPSAGLSVVVAALFLAAGVGGRLTGAIPAERFAVAAGRRAQLLVALLALYAVAVGPALDAAVSLPFAARLLVVVVALTPVGALMGAVLPLGVKLVAQCSPELLPWCWALAGAAGVVAVGAGTLVAVGLGYSALFLAAGLGYLLTAATVPEVKGPAAF